MSGSTNKEDLNVLCHRVAVKEIGSEELPFHSFIVETLAKEIIYPEAVTRMVERDFNEVRYAAQQTLSMDDRTPVPVSDTLVIGLRSSVLLSRCSWSRACELAL